jgi:hypothetical protein
MKPARRILNYLRAVPWRLWRSLRGVSRRQWLDWGLNLLIVVLIARSGFVHGERYAESKYKNVLVAERSAPVVTFQWK